MYKISGWSNLKQFGKLGQEITDFGREFVQPVVVKVKQDGVTNNLKLLVLMLN